MNKARSQRIRPPSKESLEIASRSIRSYEGDQTSLRCIDCFGYFLIPVNEWYSQKRLKEVIAALREGMAKAIDKAVERHKRRICDLESRLGDMERADKYRRVGSDD